MKRVRQFALAIGVAACLVASANAQLSMTDDPAVADAIVVTYDPADGNLSVDGNGTRMTTLELKSAGSKFTPDSIDDSLFAPPFDVQSESKLFVLKTEGFTTLDFGAALPGGMSGDDVMADLSVAGSILPQGGLDDAAGGGPYLFVVPEPASAGLMLFGLAGLLFSRRR